MEQQIRHLADTVDYDKAKALSYSEHSRPLAILHNMSLERTGWRKFFSRWLISDEPLRNDAARLLREIDYQAPIPKGSKRLEP